MSQRTGRSMRDYSDATNFSAGQFSTLKAFLGQNANV
jgi:hypothetical protein